MCCSVEQVFTFLTRVAPVVLGRHAQRVRVSEPHACPPLSPSEPTLLVRACNQLGQFLQHRETNLRYLALESMCTLASSEFSHEAVKTHMETVINALKVSLPQLDAVRPDKTQRFGSNKSDLYFEIHTCFLVYPVQTERDVSVRQRAVDLLYAMCDRSNAKQIVAEMLSYLETANYSIREEIVGRDVSTFRRSL